ncbi:MAG: circadian clock protein KaiB [Thermoleophilia bacterium]|nr:circadian clock protein KaiB [Thermoleophilia bacterium]
MASDRAGSEPDPDAPASRVQLTLYVSGRTTRSQRAIRNLDAICRQMADYEVRVVDVLEQPDLADRDKVLATPTLIRRLPPPMRRIIGDLSDREKVLVGLELQALDDPIPPDHPEAR